MGLKKLLHSFALRAVMLVALLTSMVSGEWAAVSEVRTTLHPVLHREAGNTLEMSDIARHQGQLLLQGRGANQEIHRVYPHPRALQLPSDIAIATQAGCDGALLKKPLDGFNVLIMTLTPRLGGTEVQLRQRQLRYTASANADLANTLDNARLSLNQRDADARVQHVFHPCRHTLPRFNGSCVAEACTQVAGNGQGITLATPFRVEVRQSLVQTLALGRFLRLGGHHKAAGQPLTIALREGKPLQVAPKIVKCDGGHNARFLCLRRQRYAKVSIPVPTGPNYLA